MIAKCKSFWFEMQNVVELLELEFTVKQVWMEV